MYNGSETAVDNAVEGEFYIEDYFVQPQLNRIALEEKVVQVQPKIMQVLVCLGEQPGKVITRERLFQTVWADTNVTDHVLSRSISELRKVFNDDPRNPRVIETIPKAGYRLIATVSRPSETTVDNADERDADLNGTTSPTGQHRAGGRLWAGIFALAAMLALLIYMIGIFSRHQHFHLH